ncbi:TetR family transcriptional regulator [Kitasatospora sp. NPDC018058]|uniref:TetR family transcriptional regulator n=1 Tax=Kitasatospora sp. NPDC018058 TaxID=3364025 RepID=UPI0037C05C42
MAWDTARTQQLLLDAAVEEFAESGPDGARIARVATRAGVNKERIYQYFGNKEQLFSAVLASELGKLAEAVPLGGSEQGLDLGDYAGRVFDYHSANPHFSRLLAWEGLQRGTVSGELAAGELAAGPERTAHYGEKVAAVAAAQQAGELADEVDPGRLMFAVIGLVNAWFTLPQMVRLLLSGTTDPATDREAVVTLVRRLTKPVT